MMSFIFLFLFLLHFSHYYYILNNIHSLPLINISRERSNFDAWGCRRFYSRYYRGRAYSLTNAWKLDFLPWNWCRNHVLSTRVVRKIVYDCSRPAARLETCNKPVAGLLLITRLQDACSTPADWTFIYKCNILIQSAGVLQASCRRMIEYRPAAVVNDFHPGRRHERKASQKWRHC